MGAKDRYPEEFDKYSMGRMLRSERKAHGYESPADFCAAVEEKTGCVFSRSLLYKFENGEQEIRASQLWAISFTLYGATGWQEGVIDFMKAGYKAKHNAVSLVDVIAPYSVARDRVVGREAEVITSFPTAAESCGENDLEFAALLLELVAALGREDLYNQALASAAPRLIENATAEERGQAVLLLEGILSRGTIVI